MQKVLRERLPDLVTLCAKHRVRSLAAFGSALRDDFDQARSDLDFVVEFDPMPPIEYGRAFFGLIEDLERLFGRPIDLIERATIRNPYLRDSIKATQETLYGA
jgi:uncharacterized protein